MRLPPQFLPADVGVSMELRSESLEVAKCNAYLPSATNVNIREIGYDRAIADFNHAIRLNPQHANAYNGRAVAYFKSGDAAIGLSDAMRAVELDSNVANYYDTRAHIYEMLNHKDDAIADYRKALLLDPTRQECREGLGRLGVSR